MQYHPCAVYSCIRRMLTCVRIVEHRLCSMQTKNLFFLCFWIFFVTFGLLSTLLIARSFCNTILSKWRYSFYFFICYFSIWSVVSVFYSFFFSYSLFKEKKMDLIVWTNNEYRYLKQTETARKKCFLNLHILFVSNKVWLGFWCMRSRKCGLLSSNQRAHSVQKYFYCFSFKFSVFGKLPV